MPFALCYWTNPRNRRVRCPSAKPLVEALEDRLVPTCTVTVSGPAFGRVLTVIRDDSPNAVQISRDATTGAMSVLADGVLTPVAEPGTQIGDRRSGATIM